MLPAFVVAGYSLLLFSVYSWPQGIFPWQGLVQGLLVIVLIAYGITTWPKQTPLQVSLSGNGAWLDGHGQWQLHKASRMTSWLLWIKLLATAENSGGPSRDIWVFRDAVTDDDYRRLCLAIRYQQVTNND